MRSDIGPTKKSKGSLKSGKSGKSKKSKAKEKAAPRMMVESPEPAVQHEQHYAIYK